MSYSNKETECRQCGKKYIPSEGKHLQELRVPIIFANNFCSSKCCSESMKSTQNRGD